MTGDTPPGDADASTPPPAPHTSRRTHKVVQTTWPLAAIGALSTLAGNPLTPATPPAEPTAASVSPTAYVAPDGRSFTQLVAMHVLPDPTLTSGPLNPDVTPDTVKSTICVHGWTAKVRPATDVTEKIKVEDLPPGHTLADYELDHLVSIEDGGAPDDEKNLWMQVYDDPYGARTKDVLETKVAHMVCAGTLTLDQARAALAPNWLIGFVKYVGPLPSENESP